MKGKGMKRLTLNDVMEKTRTEIIELHNDQVNALYKQTTEAVRTRLLIGLFLGFSIGFAIAVLIFH